MIYINPYFYDILLNKENNNEFQCDDNIAPIISILNKKGYKTTNSCEGHAGFAGYDDGSVGFGIAVPYIQFDKNIEFINTDNFPYGNWNIVREENFEVDGMDGNTTYKRSSNLIIRFSNQDIMKDVNDNKLLFDDPEVYDKFYEYRKKFLDAEMELFNWVKSLEEYGER